MATTNETLTPTQKRKLLMLDGVGKVEGRLGRDHLVWRSLEKRGLVHLEIIGGSMSLTTLEFAPRWDKFRITLTEAGKAAATEVHEWLRSTGKARP